MLNLAGEILDSLSNGPGMTYVLFTQGCIHQCKGCHNVHTWSIKDNLLVNVEDVFNKIKDMPFIEAVTFSGGEPFLQSKDLSDLAEMIKSQTKLKIYCYTGFTYEELIGYRKISHLLPIEFRYYEKLLNNIDILIDGKFQTDNMEGALTFTGSANQRILHLEKGVIVNEEKSVNYSKHKRV